MEKTTLTIGIPAWNEQNTIGSLLTDIGKQLLGRNIKLVNIIVASDGSTDKTCNIAEKFRDVLLIEGKTNKGKAYRENEIIGKTSSDVLVFLDADTRIKDRKFLQKLISPITASAADMTSCDIVSLMPKKFWERALWVSMEVKKKLFYEFKKGNNIYTCHGTARAFSRELYTKIDFSRNEGEDMYSYLVTVKLGKKFQFVRNTKIFYKLPDNLKDHMKQSLRYQAAIKFYKQEFGEELVNSEFSIPFSTYVRAGLASINLILKCPIYFISYCFVYIYSKVRSHKSIDTDSTWQVGSSKLIN